MPHVGEVGCAIFPRQKVGFRLWINLCALCPGVQGHTLNYDSHCPVLKARIRPSGYGHRSPSAGAAWLGSNIELRLVVGLEVADHEKVAAGKREEWSRIRVSSNKLDAMNGLHY